MSLPRIDDLTRREIDCIEHPGVEFADIDAFAVRRERDAARHGAGGNLADHLAGLQIDLADDAGIFVADPGKLAQRIGDDAVRLRGGLDALLDLAGSRIDDDNSAFMIERNGGERAIADPGDAFRFLADLDLAYRFLLIEVNQRDSAAVVVGGEQQFAVGRDIHQAVAASGQTDRGGSKKRQDSDPSVAKHAKAPLRMRNEFMRFIMREMGGKCNQRGTKIGEPICVSCRVVRVVADASTRQLIRRGGLGSPYYAGAVSTGIT